MSFVDMVYLKKKDLKNGFLTYRRKKTGQFTCLINFDSFLTDKHTEKEQDKALAKLVEKFKGKKARFSTFDFTISELTDGKEKAINDGTHTYSSLANTYLGSVEDEESEFNKLKNRMLDMVDDNFDFGQADDD